MWLAKPYKKFACSTVSWCCFFNALSETNALWCLFWAESLLVGYATVTAQQPAAAGPPGLHCLSQSDFTCLYCTVHIARPRPLPSSLQSVSACWCLVQTAQPIRAAGLALVRCSLLACLITRSPHSSQWLAFKRLQFALDHRRRITFFVAGPNWTDFFFVGSIARS